MRAVISSVSTGLLAIALVTSQVKGQPAPQPDFSRATELYKSASAAMKDGRYSDAARDYGGAYDITRDPLLFFKIGSANEKAGKCDVALIYYGRYLREAKPEPKYVEMTRERITACHGDMPVQVPDVGSAAKPPENPPLGSGASLGSGGSGGSGSAAVETPALGSAGPAPGEHAHGNDGAWLLVGGSLAFITSGAVLAYSASSSEQDLKDLYVGLDNMPPAFDVKTAQRYHVLIDEGHRYQYLSWASFGIAGACAIGAAVLFAHGTQHDEKLSVRPIVTPHETGISAVVRF